MSSDAGAERVFGRYALVGEIASGGMATVYFGRLCGPAGFSRTVAIKRLHAQYAKDPEFVAMLLDEARLATRIQHRNVVGTLDVVPIKGELLLVLEYIHGESLSRLLKQTRAARRRVPLPVVAALATEILHGLQAAHEARSETGEPLGIVHRDVSPQNILVGVDGVARVLDFGIAKASGRMQQTREGQIKGKLGYMAPEHARGLEVDRRSDVYSAAIVVWEMLTGTRLFDGDNEFALLAQVVRGASRRPSDVVPEVPAELDAIVMRGLSVAPDARFATAREMAIAIEEAVPLATPRQVGEWVTAIAGDLLARRSEQVKEVESLSTDDLVAPPSRPAPARAPMASLQTETALDGPRAEPPVTSPSLSLDREAAGIPRPRRTSRVIAVALALVVGALLLVLAVVRPWRSVTPASAALPVPSSSPSVAPLSTAVPASPSASSSAIATASPTSTASASAAPSASSPRVRKNPSVAAKTSGGSGAGASCQPPYFIDEAGIRRVKPECL